MRRADPFVILFLFSCIPVLRAQSTIASITGRVADFSKANNEDPKVAINESANVRIEIEKIGFKKTSPGGRNSWIMEKLAGKITRVKL